MIRLYIDHSFHPGDEVRLPADELRYFRSVRRGQGEVCLFNRSGQEAKGRIKGTSFIVEAVHEIGYPIHPLSVGVALPDSKTIPMIIRSLSELGVRGLYFFDSDRSQRESAKDFNRLEKLSIEACRQCRRPAPLEIQRVEFESEKFLKAFDQIVFLDEAPSGAGAHLKRSKKTSSALVLVGPEGGWSERERDIARQRGFQNCHLNVPILRVETAAICGAFYALNEFFGVTS